MTAAAPSLSGPFAADRPRLPRREELLEAWPVLAGVAASVLFFVVARLNPIQLWWRAGFQGLHVYQWWPLVAYGAMISFPLLGWLHHRRSGSAMHRPGFAALAAMVMFAISLALVTAWAASRSEMWFAVVCDLGAVGALSLAAGWIAYRESWRRWHNRSVCARVRRALLSGEFRRYVAALRADEGAWGSPHCLLVVDGHFEEMKSVLRNHLRDADHLGNCIEAGEMLLAYFDVRWSPRHAPADQWRQRRAQVLRELATLYLWAHSENPRIELDRARIERWMNEMAAVLGDSHQPYVDFLRTVFRFDRTEPGGMEQAQRVLALYAGISEPDLRDVARDTWIAVAPIAFDEQTALDVWIALHADDVDPFAAMRRDERDPAAAWAHERVAALYRSWVGRIPRGWQAPLEARAGDRAGAARLRPLDPAAIRGRVEETTAEVSSWPYRFVWSARAVVVRFLACTFALAAIHTVALVAVMPGPLFNGVEAVRDLRSWRDYRASPAHATAATPDTIALATAEDLLFFDKASRVVQPWGGDVAPLDVTRGAGEADFVLLGADQSIRGVSPRMLDLDTLWLAPPPEPRWTGRAAAGHEVVRSSLDRSGWLLALRGRGVARYRFASEGGQLLRTRSWQTSELSSIDLQDAIFTSAGAWLRTPADVAFADAKTLEPRPERRLAERTAGIDGNPSGTWATARGNGRAWLFDAAWRGPYFCDARNALRDLSEVTIARAQGGRAWLGAPNGLYRYDAGARCLSTAIAGEEIRYLAPANGKGMFAATAGSVWLAPPTGDAARIDKGAISSASLSPDGSTAFYLSDGNVRRVDLGAAPETVLPDGGWKPPTPDILAVRSEGSDLFFVTSGGAFRYGPRQRTYTDASSVAGGGKLASIRGVEALQGRTLAIGDGSPVAIAPGELAWRRLDPSGQRPAIQLTEAGGQAFGLGREGEIHRYEGSAESYLTARSEALRGRSSSDFLGDLLPGSGYRLAIAAGMTLVESAPGTLELRDADKPLPGGVRQLRYRSDGELLALLGDGSVITARDGRPLFGHGHLAAPLDAMRAMVVTRDGSAITVGGNGGTVATYDWPTGSWTAVVEPSRLRSAEVTSLQNAAGGLLVGTADHHWFHVSGDRFAELGRHRRVAGTDNLLYALGNDGLVSIRRTDAPSANWPKLQFAAGEGVARFLATAAVAWQPDEDSILFLAPSGARARYRLATDTWEMRGADYGGKLSQMQPGGSSMFAVEGRDVVRIGGDLSLEQVGHYDGTPSLHVSGGLPQVAYAARGIAILHDGAGRTVRRGGEAPQNFDPRDVVYATAEGAAIVMVDRKGMIVAYDPVEGSWSIRSAQSVPKRIRRPADGQLLDANGLIITRRGGVTSFVHRAAGPLHVRDGGFDEDRYLDAVLDAGGEMHALTPVGVVRLRPDTSGRLHLAGAAQQRPLHAPEPDVPRVFVTQPFVGGREVRWIYRPGRGVQPEWKDGGLPGIGTCGRPSWQCIADVAVAPSGELLVSSELGLMVRDAQTYALRQLFPALAGAALIPSRHAVYIRARSGELSSWSAAGGLQKRTSVPPTIAGTGPLLWSVSASGGVTVTRDGRAVAPIDAGAGRWKFADDVVRWIHRPGERLVLATAGEPWTLEGVRTSAFRGALPPDRAEQQTPAVTMTAAAGQLHFRMFDGDGLPAIVDGRFVLNRAAQIAGSGSELYTLVSGRALLRRAAADPNTILAVWRVPATSGIMDATAAGVRLKAGGLAYALDAKRGTWSTSPLPQYEQAVAADAITWRAQGGRNAHFVPHRGTTPVGGWWTAGRFSWDHIHDLVTISRDVVAFASDAGIWVGRHSADGWQTIAMRLDAAATRADEATRNGARVGAILTGSSAWLVTPAGTIQPHDGSPLHERAVVTFRITDRLVAQQSWEPQQGEPAVRSALPPDLLRIDQGQFEIDGFRSAALLDGVWWISPSHGANRLTANRANGAGLDLRGSIGAPCRFSHLRATRSGILGVCEGAAWRFDSGQWSRLPLSEVTAEFRTGEQVAFSAATTSWRGTGPDHPWEPEKRFAVDPPDYPLFLTTAAGTLLAFDDFTTVSLDRTTGMLDIGTRGGIFTTSWRDGSTRLLRVGAPLDLQLLDVARLRRDPDGTLLALSAATSLERRNGAWTPAPLDRWPAENRNERSNNAWWLGNRPLEGVLDTHTDDTATWFVTREHGIFRVGASLFTFYTQRRATRHRSTSS